VQSQNTVVVLFTLKCCPVFSMATSSE